jgi:alkylated DNA repair dioxygenase AlkB
LPGWLGAVCDRLVDEGVFAARPDRVIVNEYLLGQGISAHIDCVPCFGPVIASLSLGSAVTMTLTRAEAETAAAAGGTGSPDPAGSVRDLRLEGASLLVLSGPARSGWRHAIAARRSDLVGGVRVARGRRFSLTFRTVLA